MRRAPRRGAFALTLAAAVLVAAAAPAGAQEAPPITAPKFGDFRSVLAQGEGQTVNGVDLAAYLAGGEPPGRFVDQQPLYVDIMPNAARLTREDVDVFYKNTDFGSMPGGVGSTDEPRDGVTILRDARFGMAHIYGDTRADVMFGAGYATAQERLFLMDALRRTAKGTLAGLTGPSAAEGDAEQLTDQDFSDEELRAQFNAIPQRLGPEGQRAHADLLEYVAGINQYIDEANSDPSKLPAEYAALGARPEPWDVSDTAALAVLLVTQFTVSNGSEEVNAGLQQAFRKRFGKAWRGPYSDLRTAQDPEAVTVARRTFRSDDPGRVRRGRNLVPDPGSITPRNPMVEGPAPEDQARAAASMPDWVRSLNGVKKSLPHWASNAVLVSGRLTRDGRPVASMGPQVSYYSPQIFVEYELHGGGIDVQGVSFPGSSPYPLIGHGIDFVWSGTSANGDNNDTFVEELCPDEKSYRYRGECRPFVMREQVVTTPVSPISPEPSQTIRHMTMRSVHGPVFAFATVGGKKVALAKAKGVNFRELDAVLPFMRMAENQPTDARSFIRAFAEFPGTENWFYADDREIAFQQSGWYPLHARGADVDLPFNGDGSGDWRGFNPDTYEFQRLPGRQRPMALEPREGFIISWNNKEAPGWRKGPREWGDGPVHRALILERRLKAELKRNGGKTDLAGLTRTSNLASVTDLRGEELVPWLLRAAGRAGNDDRKFLGLLDAWHRLGGKRLDSDGDNVYENSAAVALMDAWWPRLVRGIFEPTLGKELFDRVEDDALGLGGMGWSWSTHVQKDLRTVLGKRVRGRYSRAYCGGPSRARTPLTRARRARIRSRCRTVVLTTLRQAVEDVTKRFGSSDPARWELRAVCPDAPNTCDQIEPVTAGAVETPPFPWQNRATFHQVTEVKGHRPR